MKHLEVGRNPLQIISPELECVVAEVSEIVPGAKQYARLFAAAPSMLAALELAVPVIEAAGGSTKELKAIIASAK